MEPINDEQQSLAEIESQRSVGIVQSMGIVESVGVGESVGIIVENGELAATMVNSSTQQRRSPTYAAFQPPRAAQQAVGPRTAQAIGPVVVG